MLTISKGKNKEEIDLLERYDKTPYKKLPAENVFSNTQEFVRIDPIDSKRISKDAKNSLTMRSAVKAVLVFAGTIGLYYLAKTTGIFSYFGWGAKNSNSKDINGEIAKIKNRENSLSVKTDLKGTENPPSLFTIRKIQSYDDNEKVVEFEKTEIKELNDFPEGAPYKICENSGKFQYIDQTSFYINNLYLATQGKSRAGYGMEHTAYNSRYVSIQIFKMLYAVEYIGFLDKVKDKIEVLSSKTSSKIALFYREPGQSDYSKVTVIFSKLLLDDMINCNKNPNSNVVFYDLYMDKDGTISINPKCLVPNKILCGCDSSDK